MKKIFVVLINLYQRTPLHTHSSCRFIPTCSEYTKICINRFGAIKGLHLGIKRILRCHPKGKSGIDLPPERKNE